MRQRSSFPFHDSKLPRKSEYLQQETDQAQTEKKVFLMFVLMLLWRRRCIFSWHPGEQLARESAERQFCLAPDVKELLVKRTVASVIYETLVHKTSAFCQNVAPVESTMVAVQHVTFYDKRQINFRLERENKRRLMSPCVNKTHLGNLPHRHRQKNWFSSWLCWCCCESVTFCQHPAESQLPRESAERQDTHPRTNQKFQTLGTKSHLVFSATIPDKHSHHLQSINKEVFFVFSRKSCVIPNARLHHSAIFLFVWKYLRTPHFWISCKTTLLWATSFHDCPCTEAHCYIFSASRKIWFFRQSDWLKQEFQGHLKVFSALKINFQPITVQPFVYYLENVFLANERTAQIHYVMVML